MRVLLLIIIFPVMSYAGNLERDTNHDLVNVLSHLKIIHAPIVFKEQAYSVKFFGNVSYDHCSTNYHCRGLTQLLVLTSEIGSEGPVRSLYRLPKKHEWKVIKAEHLKDGRQGIYLVSKTYKSDKPKSEYKTEKYLLKTTFFEAEINAL